MNTGFGYDCSMPRRPPDRPYADKSRGIRIQKVLAEAGIDSRRHCEELIRDGLVKVNGEVVTALPAWVDPENDRIEVDGRPIRRRRASRPVDHYYIMLNKPANVVSTNSDPYGRRRAIDLVALPGNPRLFCVGRLDAESTGLLLLTNDGALANRLTHPRYEVSKTYEIIVKGGLDAAGVETLQRSMARLDRKGRGSQRDRPVRLKLLKRDRDRTHLLMELCETHNRDLRQMLAALDHPVRKLKRVALGPLKLSGVAVGMWRPLRAAEVGTLRRAAGMGRKEKKRKK